MKLLPKIATVLIYMSVAWGLSKHGEYNWDLFISLLLMSMYFESKKTVR